MEITELEKKARKIIELRYKRSKLQKEINELVNEIIRYMDKQEKQKMKFSKYSFELVKRIKREINFNLIDKCITDGLIPESAFKKTFYRRLLITSSVEQLNNKLILKGNKFIVDKR